MIEEIGRRPKIEIGVKFMNDQPVLLDCFKSDSVSPSEKNMRLANRCEEENEGEQTAKRRIFADGFVVAIVRGGGGRGREYIGSCEAFAVGLVLIGSSLRHGFVGAAMKVRQPRRKAEGGRTNSTPMRRMLVGQSLTV